VSRGRHRQLLRGPPGTPHLIGSGLRVEPSGPSGCPGTPTVSNSGNSALQHSLLQGVPAPPSQIYPSDPPLLECPGTDKFPETHNAINAGFRIPEPRPATFSLVVHFDRVSRNPLLAVVRVSNYY
jgi:hypothetical protein